MKRSNKELDSILDKVAGEIRGQEPDSSVVSSAAERVLMKLSAEGASAQPAVAPAAHLRGCADFQTLIPSYLQGTLSSARSLLFEDHTRECVPCRKALKDARAGRNAAKANAQSGEQRVRAARPAWVRWAVAASLIAGIGLLASPWIQRLTRSIDTVYATVYAMNGPVYLVSDASTSAVAEGTTLQAGEKIRTAKDAGAVVRLADGSLIEMKERSEFSISQDSDGVTINLDRGNIIVQAAKQRERHLFVSTTDCLVSVKGTIFSVNSGTKGARVSVIEGEVHVDYTGKKNVLLPGDQVTTRQTIEGIPVKDEIAWSRDADRYSTLLTELTALRKELDARVARPGVRHSSTLLDLVPEGTVLYAALPNLSETIAESHRIMQERIEQNPTLREWWESERASAKGEHGLNNIIERIREFGQYLGAEVVVSAQIDSRGEPDTPLVLAELSDAPGFRSYLEAQLAALNAESKRAPAVRIIDDPLAAAPAVVDGKSQEEMFVWIRDDLFAASPKLQPLQLLAANMKAPGGNRFAATPFHARIKDVYDDGAGLIVAADLEKIIGHSIKEGSKEGGARESEALEQLGITSLRHFIFEMKERQGKPYNSAVVSFDNPQSGIASWLAAPGPMGALDFISPDANIVAAFVVRDPAALVDDLLNTLRTADPNLWQHLKDAEAEHGIDIRRDIAGPLGGEFAFAIDGPLLPTPSWKMVFEVYDPAHLQQTFEHVVGKLNEWAQREGRAGFRWEQEDVGGRTYYTLKSVDLGMEVNYTYASGYMIAAPSRALVDRAVRYHETGYTLTHSPKFIATLPEDKNANFSALLYHNLGSVLEPLARMAAGHSGPRGRRGPLSSLASSGPMLAYAYSYGDRIVFSINGENGQLGLSPGSLLNLPGSFGVGQVVEGAMK